VLFPCVKCIRGKRESTIGLAVGMVGPLGEGGVGEFKGASVTVGIGAMELEGPGGSRIGDAEDGGMVVKELGEKVGVGNIEVTLVGTEGNWVGDGVRLRVGGVDEGSEGLPIGDGNGSELGAIVWPFEGIGSVVGVSVLPGDMYVGTGVDRLTAGAFIGFGVDGRVVGVSVLPGEMYVGTGVDRLTAGAFIGFGVDGRVVGVSVLPGEMYVGTGVDRLNVGLFVGFGVGRGEGGSVGTGVGSLVG